MTTGLEVPAISLWQPWAWLLVHGHEHPNGKRVENRRWPLPPRYVDLAAVNDKMVGKWCLIHAAKNQDVAEFAYARDTARRAGMMPDDLWGEWTNFVPRLSFGGIVGVVQWRLQIDGESRPESGTVARAFYDSPWFVGEKGWVTEAARPLPFVPWRGSQGFFRVPLAALPVEYQWLGETK